MIERDERARDAPSGQWLLHAVQPAAGRLWIPDRQVAAGAGDDERIEIRRVPDPPRYGQALLGHAGT